MLTPEAIDFDYRNGKLSAKLALDLLISILEKSDNPEIRHKTIIALGRVENDDEKVYDILESSLLCDENDFVRAAAVNIIGQFYFKSSLKTLSWVIQYETSPIVIKTILNLIEKDCNQHFKLISNEISNWLTHFGGNLGIVANESKFFLDLEVFFSRNITDYRISSRTYEFYEKVRSITNNEPWLFIKNEHVEGLNFSFFNWNFLKRNQDLMDSYLSIRNLDSFLNLYRKFEYNEFCNQELLESIANLNLLRTLNLSYNNLTRFPDFLTRMQTIEQLNLSHNVISEIPESITNLKNLKILKLRNNKIHNVPKKFKPFLDSLNTFKY